LVCSTPIAPLDPGRLLGPAAARHMRKWLVLRIQMVGSNVLAKEERFIP